MWSVRRSLILVGAAGCWVGALSISSCSGGTTGGDDAAADTTAPDVQKEAAADTGPKDSGPGPCAVDADLNNLQVPDATIDGGVNPAACYGCIKTACPQVIAKCNVDCACKTTLADFPNCIAMGNGLLTCAGGLDPQYLTDLAACGFGCVGVCGVNAGDGGPKDASDGG